MRPYRMLPPLLLLLGLAGASTLGPNRSTPGWNGFIWPSSPAFRAVTYEDVVSAAVELLNYRAVSPFILRLREAHSQPGWHSDLGTRQDLSFTVEETTCRTPGMDSNNCKIRWLGGVTWCQGSVFLEEQQPMVELSCKKAPTGFGRIRKSKIKDFFAKIKDRFRELFHSGRIWIRDRLNLKAPRP